MSKELTARELQEKLYYIGMSKRLRKLALTEGLAEAEELATMTELEVCEVIVKKYVVVHSEAKELWLMKKEKFKEFEKDIKIIDR